MSKEKVPTIKEVEQKIIPILKSHGVSKAGLFGSVARGEATEKSDIDVLVEIGPEVGLLKFIGLKLELEKALGKKVDLVEYAMVKPALKKYILEQELQII